MHKKLCPKCGFLSDKLLSHVSPSFVKRCLISARRLVMLRLINCSLKTHIRFIWSDKHQHVSGRESFLELDKWSHQSALMRVVSISPPQAMMSCPCLAQISGRSSVTCLKLAESSVECSTGGYEGIWSRYSIASQFSILRNFSRWY